MIVKLDQQTCKVILEPDETMLQMIKKVLRPKFFWIDTRGDICYTREQNIKMKKREEKQWALSSGKGLLLMTYC